MRLSVGTSAQSSGSGSARATGFLRQRKPQRDAEMPDAQQERARALHSEKLRARLGHAKEVRAAVAALNAALGMTEGCGLERVL